MADRLILNSVASFKESSRKKTPEGYLTAKAVIAKKDVLGFYLNEIFEDVPEQSNARISVLMGDEFFDSTAFEESVARKPVTLGHPPTDVDGKNYKNYAVGHLGDTLTREGDLIIADMTITDPHAVKMIEDGRDELSVGFRTDVKSSKGEFQGKPYSLEMLKPSINHIALLDRGNGRSGPAVRILNEEPVNMSEEKQEETAPVLGKVQVELSAAPAESPPKAEPQEGTAQNAEPQEFVYQKSEPVGNMSAGATTAPSPPKNLDVTGPSDVQRNDATGEIERIARYKTRLIQNAKPYLQEGVDPFLMSNREILEASLKNTVTDMSDKSDDYLMGRLDALVQSREAASKERQSMVMNSTPEFPDQIQSKQDNILDLMNMVRGGK